MVCWSAWFCIIDNMQTCTVYALLEWFSSPQNSHHNTFPSGNDQVDDSSNSDSDGGGDCGQVIGIAVVVVLLVVAVACIVGLVIWNIKLHKKNLQLQTPNQWVKQQSLISLGCWNFQLGTQLHKQLQSQHMSWLINPKIEKDPAYSVTGVQESSVDHHYEAIPVNNRHVKTKNWWCTIIADITDNNWKLKSVVWLFYSNLANLKYYCFVCYLDE